VIKTVDDFVTETVILCCSR